MVLSVPEEAWQDYQDSSVLRRRLRGGGSRQDGKVNRKKEKCKRVNESMQKIMNTLPNHICETPLPADTQILMEKKKKAKRSEERTSKGLNKPMNKLTHLFCG